MAKRRTKGEGSLFYSDPEECWVAEISLPDGKRQRKRSKKQQIVKDWLLEQRKAVQENRVLPSQQINFSDFLDRFLSDVASHTLQPKTLSNYEYLIEKHIRPDLGKFKLAQIRPDHLQSLYSKKLDSGLSAKTVKHIHALIRRVLNQALKWDLIYRNPAVAVTSPMVTKHPLETLTEEQAKRLLEVAQDHRWYPIYVLALTTGMRQGELLGLRWEDVNFENKTISVCQTVQSIHGRVRIGQPKTASSRRTIALSSFGLSVLKDYKRETNREGLIFTTSKGTPISPRNLLRHFYKVREKAQLPDIRFHDLRHTAATFLLKENVHPKIVQEMLGHSSIILTLDTYSHIIPDIQKEAANKMDSIFHE
jgi:integrase